MLKHDATIKCSKCGSDVAIHCEIEDNMIVGNATIDPCVTCNKKSYIQGSNACSDAFKAATKRMSKKL
jgi:hypothetical protein